MKKMKRGPRAIGPQVHDDSRENCRRCSRAIPVPNSETLGEIQSLPGRALPLTEESQLRPSARRLLPEVAYPRVLSVTENVAAPPSRVRLRGLPGGGLTLELHLPFPVFRELRNCRCARWTVARVIDSEKQPKREPCGNHGNGKLCGLSDPSNIFFLTGFDSDQNRRRGPRPGVSDGNSGSTPVAPWRGLAVAKMRLLAVTREVRKGARHCRTGGRPTQRANGKPVTYRSIRLYTIRHTKTTVVTGWHSPCTYLGKLERRFDARSSERDCKNL